MRTLGFIDGANRCALARRKQRAGFALRLFVNSQRESRRARIPEERVSHPEIGEGIEGGLYECDFLIRQKLCSAAIAITDTWRSVSRSTREDRHHLSTIEPSRCKVIEIHLFGLVLDRTECPESGRCSSWGCDTVVASEEPQF
jgi:hypothetical protein